MRACVCVCNFGQIDTLIISLGVGPINIHLASSRNCFLFQRLDDSLASSAAVWIWNTRDRKKHECDEYEGRNKIKYNKKFKKRQKEKSAKNTSSAHTGGKTQESNNNCTVKITMQWHRKRVRSISECGGCKTTKSWREKAHQDCKKQQCSRAQAKCQLGAGLSPLDRILAPTLAIRDSGDIFNVTFPGVFEVKCFCNC